MRVRCDACGAAAFDTARFCSDCGAPLGTAPATGSGTDRQGEHRLATILFADMAGSVARTATLEPEAAVVLVDALLEAMTEVVLEFGGRVDRFLGDGMLAVFGAPRAREDDAVRAVMAALTIRERAERLKLPTTAGINSGEVYFGAVGGTSHRETTVMGPVVNLAARLQGKASVGQVVIGVDTERLVRHRFAVEPTCFTVKGIDEPVTAFVVQDLLHPTGVEQLLGEHPFVGRDSELTLLSAMVAAVTTGGGGRLALILGEPGVGKSRLVAELLQGLPAAARQGHLEGHAAELTAASPYGVFADLLRRLVGLGPRVVPEQDAERLQRLVDELVDAGRLMPRRTIDVLSAAAFVLGISQPSWELRLSAVTPDQRPTHISEGLVLLLGALTGASPRLIVLEDFHWADPHSVALLARMAESLDELRLAVVVTARSEWPEHALLRTTGGGRLTEITLDSLGTRDATRLLTGLLGREELPEGLTGAVVDRAGGNPFFLQELVRSLIEQKLFEGSAGHGALDKRAWQEQLPATVRAVVAARLDRLTYSVRAVAESAAALGRGFSSSLLGAVVPDGSDVEGALAALREAQLVNALGSPDEWTFSHALVRETLYHGLLPSRRATLHSTIALELERKLVSRDDALVDEIAYHYERSANDAKAVEFLTAAAARAARAYLQERALEHVDTALARVERLEPLKRAEHRAALLEQRGEVLLHSARHREAADAFASALDSVPPTNRGRSARLHVRIAASSLWSGHRDNQEVEQHLERAGAFLAEGRAGSAGDRVAMELVRGDYLYLENRLEELQALVARVETDVFASGDVTQQIEFGNLQNKVQLRAHRYVLPETGIQTCRRQLELCAVIGDPGRTATAQFLLGFVQLLRGEADDAAAMLEEALAGAAALGDRLLGAQALTYLATARRCQHDHLAEQTAEQALVLARELGNAHYAGVSLGNLAWAAWASGNAALARKRAEAALEAWGQNHYPIRWTALWPLIAVATEHREFEAARYWLAELRQPWEVAMPTDLDEACHAAVEADSKRLPPLVDRSLALAQASRYL